jgi:hypothetical protein
MNKRAKTNQPQAGFAHFIAIVVILVILVIALVIFMGATSSGVTMGPSGETTGVDSTDTVNPDGEVAPIIPLSGNCLIFGWKVESSFVPALRAGSARLGLDPNWVMAIMAVETVSTFKPCIRNPYTFATGLIQFMPDTAREMGTSIDALCGMSQTGQWRYVEEYLRRKIRAHGRPRDLGSAYMLVFTPIYTQSPDSKVMYRHDGGACRVNGRMRKTAYCQNQVYDYAPKDGMITKFEAAEAARRKYREGYARCK